MQGIVFFTSILLWGKVLGVVSAFFSHLLLQLSYSAHQRVEEWLEVLLRTYRCRNMASQCCYVILSKNKNQNTPTNQWAKANLCLGFFLWAPVAAEFWMEHLAEESKVCGVGVLYLKSDRVCLRPVASWIHKETCLAPHSQGSLKLGQRILLIWLALLLFLDFLACFLVVENRYLFLQRSPALSLFKARVQSSFQEGLTEVQVAGAWKMRP